MKIGLIDAAQIRLRVVLKPQNSPPLNANSYPRDREFEPASHINIGPMAS
jgi:hypothetical protein